jgi:sugar-specific transcriptional regulator TrmB
MFDKQEYMKQYYAVNKERMRQQTKEWYDNNKEHMREYWERTREKTRERQRRWYAKNKKVIKKMVEEKVIKIIPKIEAEPEPQNQGVVQKRAECRQRKRSKER